MRKTTPALVLLAVGAACSSPRMLLGVSSERLDRADWALARGEVGEAISLLEGYVGESIRGSKLLGRAYLELRQYEKARESFSTVIRLDSGDAEAWEAFARACEAERYFDRAIDAYRKVLDLRPKDAASARALAFLLADLHRGPEASQALRAAATLDPEDLEVRLRLGLVELERQQLEAAEGAFDLVLSRGGPQPPALLGRGLARARSAASAGAESRPGARTKSELLAAAAQDFEAAAALATADPAPSYNLGWMREELQRDVAGAAEAYREALRRRPDHAPSLVRLAGIERAAGRRAEALELSRRAREASADPRTQRALEKQIEDLERGSAAGAPDSAPSASRPAGSQ